MTSRPLAVFPQALRARSASDLSGNKMEISREGILSSPRTNDKAKVRFASRSSLRAAVARFATAGNWTSRSLVEAEVESIASAA